MKRSFLYIAAICMAISCGADKKGRIVQKNDNHGDPVLTVEADDKEMNRAIDSAKKTYAGFLSYFTANSRDTNKSGFGVKVRFGLGDDCAEHMWLNDLYFKGDKFYGVLDNDPIDVQTLK